MLIVLSTAFAMLLWIVLWALNVKSFDAFMAGLLVMLLAVTAHIVLPYLPGNRKAADQQPDPAPYT
jgi:hypothetical protein